MWVLVSVEVRGVRCSLELELQANVSHPVEAVGTEPESSGRTVCTFNLQPLSTWNWLIRPASPAQTSSCLSLPGAGITSAHCQARLFFF